MNMSHIIIRYKNSLFFLLLVWEIVVVLLDLFAGSNQHPAFQYAARLSARTSYILIIVLSLWVALTGLNRIFKNPCYRQLLLQLLVLFSINHVIHLVYVFINHYLNKQVLFRAGNIPGALVYVLIVVLPLIAAGNKEAGARIQLYLYISLNIILIVFGLIYLSRLLYAQNHLSPGWLYLTFLIVNSILIMLNMYRGIKDYYYRKRIPFSSN